MIALRKSWEGQVVDDKFVLVQYLGGSNTSAVFLTQVGEANPLNAAIKLIPADSATADLQLSIWRQGGQLSHPNLLRLFDFGRCRIENTAMLYVVVEFADENLSQILPERALTPAEARDMLQPVLDALLYLQEKGLVHNSVKPSNIHAVADQLKLAVDTLWPAGEPRATMSEATPYSPPESVASPYSPADPVWSLGITVFEALTQQFPSPQELQKRELPFPEALPAPFLAIVRRALRLDSQQRASLAGITALLNPESPKPAPVSSSARPPAAVVVSPLAVPLSSVPPLLREQLARQQATPPSVARSTRGQESRSRSKYFIPVATVVLLAIAVFAFSKFAGRHSESPSASSVATAPEPVKPKAQPAKPLSDVAAAHPSSKEGGRPAPPNALQPTSQKETTLKAANSINPSPASATSPSTAVPEVFRDGSPHGEVLDQVLPEVSQKARETIQGRVRVTVLVHVDPSGLVTAAELNSPGYSKYFSEQAVQAARRWQFQSPESSGHSLPSEWLLEFEFTPSDTRVQARQAKP
jgi:TonB family protein